MTTQWLLLAAVAGLFTTGMALVFEPLFRRMLYTPNVLRTREAQRRLHRAWRVFAGVAGVMVFAIFLGVGAGSG